MDLEDDAPPELVDVQADRGTDASPQEINVKVPITIVTGYLGAGKTTLLNYILTARHGKKIAVIMNGRSAWRAIVPELTSTRIWGL